MNTIRPDRLNALAAAISARSYLEIGVSRGSTFNRVNIARKVAVDPVFRFDTAADAAPGVAFHRVPSDAFFSRRDPARPRFDLIYLDGLHTFEQTFRDFCASLACALGSDWMVLMNRHGVTVAGTGVKDCVFRTIYSARNAEYQVRALTIGSTVASLTPGEAQLAGSISSKTTGLMRSWEYWEMRVAKAGGRPIAAKKPARAAKLRRGGKKRRR